MFSIHGTSLKALIKYSSSVGSYHRDVNPISLDTLRDIYRPMKDFKFTKTGNDRSSRVRTTASTVAWKTQKSAGTVGHCRQGSWYNPLRVSPIRLPSQQTRYKEKTRVSVVFPCRWKESTRREISRISIFQVSSFLIYNTSCSFVLLKTLHTAHFFGPKLWFVLIDILIKQ